MGLLSSSIDEDKENNQKTLNKTKKDKQKYKKLATMSKLKVTALSKELNNIKRNFQTELRAKTLEMNQLNKQIHEVERQRDEIKFRLTMDTTNTMSSIHNKHHGHCNDTDLITNNVDILLKELQIEQTQSGNNNISLLTPKLNQTQNTQENIDNHSNAENVNS